MNHEPQCDAIRLAAMALGDGETAPHTRMQVDAHLQTCAACRTEVAEWPSLASAQRAPLPAVDLWPTIAPRLMESPPTPGRRHWIRRTAIALATIASSLLVVALWRMSGDEMPVADKSSLATPKEDRVDLPYSLPYAEPKRPTVAEYRARFAPYFEREFQARQAQGLPAGIDLEALHGEAIDLPEGHLGTIFFDEKGEVVLAIPYPVVFGFSEGLAAVGTKLDAKHMPSHFGFVDRTGKLVIPATFGAAEPFSEGLAAVQIGGRWGFIDKQGKQVIAPRPARYVGAFEKGIATIFLDDKLQFIDKSGKLLLESSDAGRFSEGLLYVNLPGTRGVDNGRARGYLDTNFKFAFRLGEDSSGFWPARCLEFHDGMAAVELGNHQWGFITRRGKLIPGRFFIVKPFSDGLAAVAADRARIAKFGYVDKDGAWAIPADYYRAESFSEGLAAVLLPAEKPVPEAELPESDRGKPQMQWGYIDREGQVVIPGRFHAAGEFKHGLAYASRGQAHRGYVNKQGEYVFEAVRPQWK
jgi:hypothetical protein